jgi:hypothetical protein
MVPELRFWVQFHSVMQFFDVRISPSLASVEPAVASALERE